MKVYVVFLTKRIEGVMVDETIGVRRTPEEANKLLDGRYGGFCEYETKPKK